MKDTNAFFQVSKVAVLVAILMSLAITFGTARGVGAAPLSPNASNSFNPASCISATSSQVSGVPGQTINVNLTLKCIPLQDQFPIYYNLDWNDNTGLDQYLVCPSDCGLFLPINVEVSHTYSRASNYNVALIYQDRSNHYLLRNAFTVVIKPTAPSYNIATCLTITPTSQSVLVGQTATLTVQVKCVPPYDAPPINLVIDWGLGQSEDLYPICFEVFDCNNFESPTTITATHAYTAIGVYSLHVIVRDQSYLYTDATVPFVTVPH